VLHVNAAVSSWAGDNGQQVLAHLPAAHLSDHPGAVEALMTVIKPGMTLPGPLLVLQQRRLKVDPADGRWQLEPQGEGGAGGGRGTCWRSVI
jgi:hypothetical protein